MLLSNGPVFGGQVTPFNPSKLPKRFRSTGEDGFCPADGASSETLGDGLPGRAGPGAGVAAVSSGTGGASGGGGSMMSPITGTPATPPPEIT